MEMRELWDIFCCTARADLRERETSRPLLGAQSPLQTDGTTERTSFVPYLFSSYTDANICSLTLSLNRAQKQEDLTKILFAIFE